MASSFGEGLRKLSGCLWSDTRYTARPRRKTAVHIQPPFLRPEVDRPLKLRDNGIPSQNKV